MVQKANLINDVGSQSVTRTSTKFKMYGARWLQNKYVFAIFIISMFQ